MPCDPESLTAVLSAAGFVAAGEEAEQLIAAAAGDADLLDSFDRPASLRGAARLDNREHLVLRN